MITLPCPAHESPKPYTHLQGSGQGSSRPALVRGVAEGGIAGFMMADGQGRWTGINVDEAVADRVIGTLHRRTGGKDLQRGLEPADRRRALSWEISHWSTS